MRLTINHFLQPSYQLRWVLAQHGFKIMCTSCRTALPTLPHPSGACKYNEEQLFCKVCSVNAQDMTSWSFAGMATFDNNHMVGVRSCQDLHSPDTFSAAPCRPSCRKSLLNNRTYSLYIFSKDPCFSLPGQSKSGHLIQPNISPALIPAYLAGPEERPGWCGWGRGQEDWLADLQGPGGQRQGRPADHQEVTPHPRQHHCLWLHLRCKLYC